MNRTLRWSCCSLTILLLAGAPLVAAGLPDPEQPGLDAGRRLELLIERTKLEQAAMRTLAADFVQRRESALLAAATESHGRFVYAAEGDGDTARVRWEYVDPEPMTVLIEDKQMTTWFRDLGRAERIKIGRYADQVFKYLGTGGSIDSLEEYFRVAISLPGDAVTPYRLELEPRYTRMKKRLAGITIWVDRKLYLPTRFRYLEADGDSTEYEFRDVVINGEVPADTFELELPAGVVVREVSLDRSGG